MPKNVGWIVLSATLALVGCASDERQWMKIVGTYTTADFRRDYAECSKTGPLDDDCMKRRGWVAVRAGKPADAAVPEAERSQGLGYRPRGPGGGVR